MPHYLLFLRGGYEAYANYSPAEVQQAIQKYRDWSGQLRDQRKLVAAEKIKDGERRILRSHNREIVVEGPLPDTDETIGGYFTIAAGDLAEAIEVARSCPIFAEGGSIELREIEET